MGTAVIDRRDRRECTIRDAIEADLPAIVDIFNATVATRMSTAVLEPVTVEERLPWFREHSSDGHPLWCARSMVRWPAG